jgi:hypothetical protein
MLFPFRNNRDPDERETHGARILGEALLIR